MAKQTWTKLEDFRLMEAVKKHIDKWSVIASGFSNRTLIDCMNRAKQLQQDQPYTLSPSTLDPNVQTTAKSIKEPKKKRAYTRRKVPIGKEVEREKLPKKFPMLIPTLTENTTNKCEMAKEPVTKVTRKMIPLPKRAVAPVPFLSNNGGGGTSNSSKQSMASMVYPTSASILSPVNFPETDGSEPSPLQFEAPSSCFGSTTSRLHENESRSRTNSCTNENDEPISILDSISNADNLDDELANLWEEHASLLTPKEKEILQPTFSASSVLFNDSQIFQLRQQMHANFQIITQAYSLQRELLGSQHYEVQWWEHKLRQVSAVDYCAQVLTVGAHSTLAVNGANRIMEIFKLPAFDIPSERTIAFRSSYAYQNTKTEKNKIEKIYQSYLNKGVFRNGRNAPVTLPESLIKIATMFRDTFDPQLSPVIFRVRTCRVSQFSDVEDELLFLGCRMFGFDDHKSIRALFLPARTITQIYRRIRSLTSRASKGCSLKTLFLMPFKPMNAFDKHVLISGAAIYGTDFINSASQLFDDYPQIIVKFTWNMLHTQKLVPCSWDVPIPDDDALQSIMKCVNTVSSTKSARYTPALKVIRKNTTSKEPSSDNQRSYSKKRPVAYRPSVKLSAAACQTRPLMPMTNQSMVKSGRGKLLLPKNSVPPSAMMMFSEPNRIPEPVSSIYDNFDLHTEMVIPSSPVYGAEETEISCFREHFTRPSRNEQHFQRHQPPRFVNRSQQSAYSERRQQPLRHVNSHLNINYAQFPTNKIETKSQYYQNAPIYPSNTTNNDRRFGPTSFGRIVNHNLNVPSMLRNQSHQQSNTDLSSALDSNYNQSDALHKINDADLFADLFSSPPKIHYVPTNSLYLDEQIASKQFLKDQISDEFYSKGGAQLQKLQESYDESFFQEMISSPTFMRSKGTSPFSMKCSGTPKNKISNGTFYSPGQEELDWLLSSPSTHIINTKQKNSVSPSKRKGIRAHQLRSTSVLKSSNPASKVLYPTHKQTISNAQTNKIPIPEPNIDEYLNFDFSFSPSQARKRKSRDSSKSPSKKTHISPSKKQSLLGHLAADEESVRKKARIVDVSPVKKKKGDDLDIPWLLTSPTPFCC